MTSTRRGLLIGAAGAGLVALEAQIAGARDRRRQCSVGDIERLDRKVNDLNARLLNMQARLTNKSGDFGPGTFHYGFLLADTDTFPTAIPLDSGTSATKHLTPFPGSIIGLSVVAANVYFGSPGVDYLDIEVYVNDVGTGCKVRIEGTGETAYLVQPKGTDVFAAGATIQAMALNRTGAPLHAGIHHSVDIWVSYT